MSKHVAVNPKDHKTTRISSERSEAMGDGVMCCITFPEEFRSVQAHYPILFQRNAERNEFRCLAIFGFENGENLFLDDGRWTARYIPLSMDVLPFMIGVPKSDADERKVVLDMDNPRIDEENGTRLFDDAGVPTPYLESVSKKLGYLDDGFKRSNAYIKALTDLDLLEPLSIDVTLKDGSKNRLAGFHTIHEEKLRALSKDDMNKLHEKGYLQPTYMMLASLSNLSQLIERKDKIGLDEL